MDKLIMVIVLAVFAQQGLGDLVELGNEETMRKTMLQGYDKKVNPDEKVIVNITGIDIYNLDMYEVDHALDLHTFFKYSWLDKRLKWPKESLVNRSHIGMDPDTVWKPDLSVYNAAVGASTEVKSQLPVVVFPNGKVLFIPVYHFHFSCLMDLTYWPHDTHNCSLKLGSWIHSGLRLDFNLENFKFVVKTPSIPSSQGGNISRSEWNIISTEATRNAQKYDCCPETYINILLSLQVQRNAPAYAWTAKMPAACLSILTLIIFLLPPSAGEKLILGSLCLILDLVYLHHANFAISHAPSHTPLLVQLVCQQIILLLVSVITSAVTVRMSKGPHPSGLPSIIKGPVIGLSYLLCLRGYAKRIPGSISFSFFGRSAKTDEVELGEECIGDLRHRAQLDCQEWLLLSAVIDRFFLIVYMVVCIVNLFRFSCVL